jgi:hypothetical protein
MKHIKSLNEYFDSEELRDVKDFDKNKFMANQGNILNILLTKLLARNEYLNEFDAEINGNNLSFYYKDEKIDDTFSISIINKKGQYELTYGFENDDKYVYSDKLWYDEQELMEMFKTNIKEAFIRYKQIDNNLY